MIRNSIKKMTSPAINGQKDKTESSSTSEEVNTTPRNPPSTEGNNTAPLTAWWRVFKLANLLMQQGC